MTWENRLTFEALADVRNSNPYFETNASGWTGKGGSLVRSTAQFHEGAASGLLTPTGVAATTEAESNTVPVVVAASYQLTAWVRCAVARNITLNINWFSASAYLSTSSATPVAVLANTWTFLTFTATAPVTAASATGLVSMSGTPPVGHTLHFDEVIFTNVDESGGQWTSLTTRIRDQIQPIALQIGRQNDLDQAEPARLDLLLDNSDDALTYGNTASPYSWWWGPGRKVRLRETIAGTTTTLFTGYLQAPTESVITAGIEQRVSITAMDRLGQLASDEPFISTLGAGILASSNLVLYYPLNDARLPFRPVVGTGNLTLRSQISTFVGGTTVAPEAMVTPAAIDGPPGDDVRYPNFAPIYFDPPTPVAGSYATPEARNIALVVPVAAGSTVAVSVWLRPRPQIAALAGGLQDSFFLQFGDVVNDCSIIFFDYLAAGAAAWFQLAANTVTLQDSQPFGREVWRLATARINLTSGAFDLWIGSTVALSGTHPSPPAGGLTFTYLLLGNAYFGSLAQVQVRVGAFTRADHLAQAAIGMTGLERQTTGDRIRTIAGYAGVPAAELTGVDTGQSVMQAARLAGQTPLEAMRDAERTEQGLLYADGNGNVVFKDRSSLYNI